MKKIIATGETRNVSSMVLPDGALVEMIYKPEDQKVSFIAMSEGSIAELDSIPIETKDGMPKGEVLPLDAKDPMVRDRFIRLPSGILPYKENQDLFDEIMSFTTRYFQVEEQFAPIIATYVLMSWIYDRFNTVGYLRFIGAPGTGKTRALMVTSICYKATVVSGSATSASIFRTIDDIRGTFLIDEADFRSSELSDGIVKILNSGHSRGLPVIRMEKVGSSDKFTTKTFNVFGPKVLSSRERYKDIALESRCISLVVWPVRDLTAPIHLNDAFEQESEELRNKLLAFRFRNFHRVVNDDTRTGVIKMPRMRQTFLALVNTAELVSGTLADTIVEFAKKYEQELVGLSAQDMDADVVISIIRVLYERKKLKRFKDPIHIGDIARRYNQDYTGEFKEKYTWFENTDLKVSPRKIGEVVSKKLMLRTGRGPNGFFILPSEYPKLRHLAQRYGITRDIVGTDDDEDTDGLGIASSPSVPIAPPTSEGQIKEIVDGLFGDTKGFDLPKKFKPTDPSVPPIEPLTD